MGSYTTKLAWEPLRTLTAPFTGTFQAVGTPLAHPSYICKLVNNSTVLVTISIDGVTAVDVAPANSFWLYDEGKGMPNPFFPSLPKGTQIYVNGTGGTGSVYLVTQYIVEA